MSQFINVIGYYPTNKPQPREKNFGCVMRINIDYITAFADVDMTDVIKSCRINVRTDNDGDAEQAKKDLGKFCLANGYGCTVVDLASGKHVFIKTSSERLMDAIKFLHSNHLVREVNMDNDDFNPRKPKHE